MKRAAVVLGVIIVAVPVLAEEKLGALNENEGLLGECRIEYVLRNAKLFSKLRADWLATGSNFRIRIAGKKWLRAVNDLIAMSIGFALGH